MPPRGRGKAADRALSIFESVLNEQQQQQQQQRETEEAWEDTTNDQLGPDMQLYEALSRFQEMRSQPDVPVSACFKYFLEHIYPHADVLPRSFRHDATRLLDEVAALKQRDYATDLITVTQYVELRRRIDGMRHALGWMPLLMGLIDHIYRASSSAGASPSLDALESSLGTQRALLRDLVGAWQMYNLPDVVLRRRWEKGGSLSPEFRLPPLDMNALERCAKKGNLHLALAKMFPRYAPRQLNEGPGEGLTPALIATFALLTDRTRTRPDIRQIASDFLDRVARILSMIPVDDTTLHQMFRDNQPLGSYVVARWSELTKAEGRLDNKPPVLDGSPLLRKESAHTLHKWLGQALKSRDLEECERIWRVFWGSSENPHHGKMKEIQINYEMFDYFIMVFATMRRPSRAMEVWSSMAKARVRPTLKTWTSFFEGCKRSSNAVGINMAWENLARSGLQLDTAVWTARISGLMRAGQVEAGLEALEEMRQMWEQSQQSRKPSSMAVEPSVAPVNAALAGLLKSKHSFSTLSKVLQWADRQGIAADVTTFNTLLRCLAREGLENEMSVFLGLMKKQGIRADGATFTIILDHALGHEGDELPEKQVEKVNAILSNMRDAGVQVNMQTYAKMIHLFLGQGHRAEASVKAVLTDIWDKGLELSPHIYTMLAEHYFSRDPPDLEAVRRLIETPKLAGESQKMGIDRVFWERVIRGYAQAGDATSALKYFEKIANSQSVTSSTLEALLRALVGGERWDEAVVLVNRVRTTRLLGPEDPLNADARYWKHGFWHVADRYGLLDPLPQQPVPSSPAPAEQS